MKSGTRGAFCSACQRAVRATWTKSGWSCVYCGENLPDDVVNTEDDERAERANGGIKHNILTYDHPCLKDD